MAQGTGAQPTAISASAGLVSDAEALTTLQKAYQALVTTPVATAQEGCIVQATSQSAQATPVPIVWTQAGTQLRIDETTPSGLVSSIESDTVNVQIINGQQTALNHYTVDSRFAPMLFTALLNTDISGPYRYVGPAQAVTINGVNALSILVRSVGAHIDSRFSFRTWYINPQNGLPIRLDYNLPGTHLDMLGVVGASLQFSNYQNIGGNLYPYTVLVTINGTLRKTITTASIECNQTIPPSTFAGQ